MGRSKWKKSHKGNTLRSGLEKRLATFLDSKGQEYTYEEDKLTYIVPEKKHTYLPDFKLSNGIYIEAKGKWDSASRTKMALVIEQNPDKDIRMLFQRDNTISKTSKTRYSDWCEKRGIKYHVSSDGELPDDWLPKRRRRKRLDG